MKANFMCFKLSKTILLFSAIIAIELTFIIVGIISIRETNNFEQMKKDANAIAQEKKNIQLDVQNNNKNEINTNNIEKNEIEQVKIENTNKEELKQEERPKLEEYKNMPRELKGYKVIGKIEIPKINLTSYILSETNNKSLKVAVTKLYGPEINKIGNFCIAGHNYKNNKMFGGIKKLEKQDEIILTDTYDRSVKYQVYDTYKTSPKDVNCLNQQTNSEREVTLITCTTGAIQRVIVKAIEVYD